MENPYDSPFTGEYGELMDEDLADIEAKGLRHEPELRTCECGWTSGGGGRGCGHCADCSGEHCECGLPEFPHGEFPNARRYYEEDRRHDLYIDPGVGLLPTGERIEDMD